MKHSKTKSLETNEALTYMVCDVVAGIVHAALDYGFQIDAIEDSIQSGINHAKYERRQLERGECSHCGHLYKTGAKS